MTDSIFIEGLQTEFKKLHSSELSSLRTDVNSSKSKVNTLESKVTALENKPTAPSPKAYIVETWHNGNNWYRRYSDGFIEQGGKVTSNFYATTVTLSKSYPSSTYTIITYIDQANYINPCDLRLKSKTASKFSVEFTKDTNGTCYWYTAGY